MACLAKQLALALGGVREDKEVGTDWGHWDHFQRDRSFPARTLQRLAPCVRHRLLLLEPSQAHLGAQSNGLWGTLSMWGTLGGHPYNQRHLCPDASLSLQTPASLQALEEPPYHLSAVSGRHFCTWEKYLFLGVWEAGGLQGARTVPIQPPLPCCLCGTGSLGVGWGWIDKHREEVIISAAQWAQ